MPSSARSSPAVFVRLPAATSFSTPSAWMTTDPPQRACLRRSTAEQPGESGRRRRDPRGDKLEIWVATRAEQRGAGRAEQTFVLYDGERYEGVPGSGRISASSHFTKAGIRFAWGVERRRRRSGNQVDGRTAALDDPRDRAELQWRTLRRPCPDPHGAGRAFGEAAPRQGRFGRIGSAILVFFVYYPGSVAARTWVETEGALRSAACGGCTRSRCAWRSCCSSARVRSTRPFDEVAS